MQLFQLPHRFLAIISVGIVVVVVEDRRDVHNHLANCPLWPLLLLLLLLVAWLPLCVVIINLCARFINDNNESCLILLKSLSGLHIHILHLHLHLLCYRC